MIIFALRTLTALISLGSWDAVRGNSLYSSVIFSLFMTISTFAALLAMLIFAVKAKNISNAADIRRQASKALFVLTVIVLAFAIAYTISEILILVFLNSYLGGNINVTAMNTQIIFSIFFDVAFCVFSIVNVVKSRLFIGELKNLS